MKYLIIVLILINGLAHAEWGNRKWTNDKGDRSFTGSLMSIHEDSGEVVIKNKKGIQFNVKIKKLSREDKKYLEGIKTSIKRHEQYKKQLSISESSIIKARRKKVRHSGTTRPFSYFKNVKITHIDHVYNVLDSGILAKSVDTDLFIVCDASEMVTGKTLVKYDQLYHIGYYSYTNTLGSVKKVKKCTPNKDVFFKWHNEQKKLNKK